MKQPASHGKGTCDQKTATDESSRVNFVFVHNYPSCEKSHKRNAGAGKAPLEVAVE